MGLFNKETKPSQEEIAQANEKQRKDDIKTLQAAEWEITRKIHFVTDPRKIAEMQALREKIAEQLTPLLKEQKTVQQEQELEATKTLIRDNLHKARGTANGHDITFNAEKLTARVTFFPCGHVADRSLNDFALFKAGHFWKGQIFDVHTGEATGGMSCQQCRAEKAKLHEKGLYDDKPIGVANWTLRFLK